MLQAWEDNFDGSDVLSKAMVDAKGSEEPLAQGRCNGFGGGVKAVKISGSDFEENEELAKAERKQMTLYSLESALVLTLSMSLCRVFKTHTRPCMAEGVLVLENTICGESISACCKHKLCLLLYFTIICAMVVIFMATWYIACRRAAAAASMSAYCCPFYMGFQPL